MDEKVDEIRHIKIDVSRTQIEKDLLDQLRATEQELAIKSELVDALKSKLQRPLTGGGTVPLNQPTSEKFESYGQMIDEIYRKANKGDPIAMRQRDTLWEHFSQKGLEKIAEIPFLIQACPKCGRGNNLRLSKICNYCGFDYAKYKKDAGDQ